MIKKNALLIFAAFLVLSCSRNKEEQMLFDYQQNQVSGLNFDLNDLDFKIKTIEKLGDITAEDSMKIKKKELAEYWKEDPEQSLIDTLRFNYVIDFLDETIALKDTMFKLYQESVLTAIELDDFSYRLDSERNRDKSLEEMFEYMDILSKVKALEKYYITLSKKPDSVLTAKYRVAYSFKNPMLSNVKQTFSKILYTNATQTAFIGEETEVENLNSAQ